MPAEHKELILIDGTMQRFDGYNYLSKNPKPMLDWFQRFMGWHSNYALRPTMKAFSNQQA